MVYTKGVAYQYHSRRSVKRLARKSKRNFAVTLIIIALLIFATVTWILPSFINALGGINNILKPSQKTAPDITEKITLAPPVINIPYEATNTAQIDIKGYGTPGSRVKLYIDDEFKVTTDVLSDGSFIFEKVDLSLGTNNISGISLDEENKESLPSKVVKLIYDNEKPNLDISEPEDGKKIQGGDKKVKVSGKTDPGTQVFINNNLIIVDKDGNFNTDLTLNDGDNIIFIKAIDNSLNKTEIQRMINYTP